MLANMVNAKTQEEVMSVNAKLDLFQLAQRKGVEVIRR